VQKNASTIAIAFLAGLIVAGGGAYVATTLRSRPALQPAAATASVPQATMPQQQVAATSAQPAPAETPEAAASSPSEEPAGKPQPGKRRPSPQIKGSQRTEAAQDENSAAPQPTRAEIAQNAPAAAVPAQPPPPQQAAAPSRPLQTLNPPPDTQTAPPPPREPRTVTLAAGTPITVRVNETISTGTNYAGDTFTASLDRPLIVDGSVIADRGSRVIGKVLQAEKAGRVKGLSNLQLAITQLHTTDGQTVNIETNPWNKEGPSSKKRDGAEIAGGAALGAIIGAIAGGGKGAAIGAGAGGAAGTGAVMTQRGKDAVIPSETRITFSLANNVPITEKLN
jgi:hypothetical protein